jgi:hypothetical protein
LIPEKTSAFIADSILRQPLGGERRLRTSEFSPRYRAGVGRTSSYRTGFFILSFALVASLVMHVVRAERVERRDGDSPHVALPSAAGHPASTASPTGSADPSCSAKLTACREESWKLVSSTIANDLKQAHAPRPTTSAGVEPPEPSGALDQRRVRCDIAEQQAREHWVKHRVEILASVKDVGTATWVQGERKKTLDGIAKILGADPGELRRFDHGYDALWTKHGPILHAQVTAEPVDAAALIGSVRGLWHDEDSLIESIMGAHARDEYRASELRSRTAIVAILAALANKPFDESLTW